MTPLSEYLIALVGNSLYYLDQLHAQSESEVLHQFRVNLRQCHSLLKLFQPHCKAKKRVKLLLKQTNTIRDMDVLLESKTLYFEKADRASIQNYRNILFEESASKPQRLKMRCDLQAAIQLLKRKPVQKSFAGKKVLVHKAFKHYRKSVQQYKAITAHTPLKRTHKIRLQFKIARYALLYLHNNNIKKCTKEIAYCKAIQTDLGSLQDMYQQIKVLQRLQKQGTVLHVSDLIAHLESKLIHARQTL